MGDAQLWEEIRELRNDVKALSAQVTLLVDAESRRRGWITLAAGSAVAALFSLVTSWFSTKH
jgi:hypothetical protein